MTERLEKPTTIDDLPVEIFSHILFCLQEVNPLGAHKDHILGWLNATYVSKSWRAAALSNHMLWTRIPLNMGKTWSRVFIERSRPLPVDIDLERRLSNHWEDLLFRHFPRIRSFAVENDHRLGDSRDPIYCLLKKPSETLETLILHRGWKCLTYPLLRPHQYPRLRTLHVIFDDMYADELPWRDIGAAGLTELRVHLRHPRRKFNCLANILHLLSQHLSLIIFELRIFPLREFEKEIDLPVDSSFTSSGVSTHLSNLEHLTLEAEGELVLRILEHISFATSAEAVLIPTPARAVERSTIYSILVPWISARSLMAPPKILSFTSGQYQRVQMSAGRSFDVGRGVFLRLNIDPALQAVFPGILCSLEPDAIRYIDIAVLTQLSLRDDQLLSHLTSTCNNVTRITILNRHDYDIAHNDVAGAIAIILRRLLLPAADSLSRPSFPGLMMLDLAAFNKQYISARCTHPEDARPYRVMPPTFADSLASIVKGRREAGGVMPRIYVQEWTGAMSRFEEDVLDVVRTIPGVQLLPEGSRVQFDEISGEVRT